MKMDPICFRERFGNGNSEVCPGFTPFTEGDAYVFERAILVIPGRWKSGYFIEFKIIESFTDKGFGFHQRTLISATYYDKDNEVERELIANLASGDLRGELATKTAETLYRKLFLFSKWMRQYLPEVVAYHESIYDQYKFEKTTGKVS